MKMILSSLNLVRKIDVCITSEENEESKLTSEENLFNNLLPTCFSYPTSTRRHGNFAGVHTLLRILLSSNSAVLINIITGVSPPHFDFVVYYVLCQC
jgi:hypothetical protein